MGKSTLVKHYIQINRSKYVGFWWLRASSRQTIISDLASLADIFLVQTASSEPEQRAKAALVHLQSQNKQWLLVYDSAEKMEYIRNFLIDGVKIHSIVTSRERNWPNNFIMHSIIELNESDAIRLLVAESGRSDIQGDAGALVNALDRLPLAIVIAGAWLKDVVSEGCQGFLQHLDERIKHKPESVSDYNSSLYGSVMISIDSLSDDARNLLKILCWLSAEAFQTELIRRVSARNDEEEWKKIFSSVVGNLPSPLLDTSAIELALTDLRDRSLIEQLEDGTWRMHRLTQEVQRSLLGVEDSEASVQWQIVAQVVIAASCPDDPHSEMN